MKLLVSVSIMKFIIIGCIYYTIYRFEDDYKKFIDWIKKRKSRKCFKLTKRQRKDIELIIKLCESMEGVYNDKI